MHAVSAAGFVEESAFLGEYHNVDKTGQSGMLYCETSLGLILIVFCARVTQGSADKPVNCKQMWMLSGMNL